MCYAHPGPRRTRVLAQADSEQQRRRWYGSGGMGGSSKQQQFLEGESLFWTGVSSVCHTACVTDRHEGLLQLVVSVHTIAGTRQPVSTKQLNRESDGHSELWCFNTPWPTAQNGSCIIAAVIEVSVFSNDFIS